MDLGAQIYTTVERHMSEWIEWNASENKHQAKVVQPEPLIYRTAEEQQSLWHVSIRIYKCPSQDLRCIY